MSNAAEETPTATSWTTELARKLSEQRLRMHGDVDAQRERIRALESSLEQRFSTIRSAIEHVTLDSQLRESSSAAKLAEIKREEERLAQRSVDLAKQRGELEALHSGLEETQQTATARQLSLLEEVSRQLGETRQRETALGKLKHEAALAQREAEASHRACAERQAMLQETELTLEIREEALRSLEAALHEKQLELATRKERTSRQRISLARELRARRKELLAEMEQRRLLGDSHAAGEHVLHYASDQAELERLHAFGERELRQLQLELSRQKNELDSRERELRRRRSAIAAELRARRKEMLAEISERQAEFERYSFEAKSTLAIKLAEMQTQFQHVQFPGEEQHAVPVQFPAATNINHAPPADDSTEAGDLRQRLEMALADLREEKKRNAELRELPKPALAVVASIPNGALDWETRKQNLLAQLESDYSDAIPREKAEKLTLQAVIRQTEQVLNAKDAELQELRCSLAEQTNHVGELNLGAAALSQLLSHDEIILQERENLRALQEKVREQFKQAEIEISLERARLARERQEMEEKIQRLEKQKNPIVPVENAPLKAKPASSFGGRWLARLGLQESDDEHG